MNETVIASRTETKRLPDRHQIDATARLVKYEGNQSPHFSVTGEILNLRRRGDNQFESGGCIHDEISRYFPALRPVIAVHLADALIECAHGLGDAGIARHAAGDGDQLGHGVGKLGRPSRCFKPAFLLEK